MSLRMMNISNSIKIKNKNIYNKNPQFQQIMGFLFIQIYLLEKKDVEYKKNTTK